MIKNSMVLVAIISFSILKHNPQNENSEKAVVGIPISNKKNPALPTIVFWDKDETNPSKINEEDVKKTLPDGFKNKKEREVLTALIKALNEKSNTKAHMFFLTENEIKSAIKIGDSSFEFYMTDPINNKKLPFKLKKVCEKYSKPKYELSPAEKITQSEFYECSDYGAFYQAKYYTKESVFYGKSQIARIYTCYGLFVSDEKPAKDKDCMKIKASNCFHRTSPRAMWYILNEQKDSFFGLPGSKESS